MAVIMSQATRTIDKIAEYALNDKEGQKGDRYVVATGVGCHPTTFKQQARSDRRRAKKLRGYVEGYALVQSFAKYELDPAKEKDWERANELGVVLGKAVAGGRPFIVVTQLDGKSGCLHNHIVISSVHPVTGRSFDSSVVTHGVLARTHDQVLAANGFIQTTELKAHRQLHDSTKKIAMRANGQYVWSDDLTARVESALADERAVDEASFLAVLGDHGVDVGPNPDRSAKDWTFGMADPEKVNEAGEPVYRKSRGSRLAASLTKAAIRQQLAQKERQAAAVQQQADAKPVSAPAPTEPAETGAVTTIEETYAAIFGDALGPTSAPAPAGGQASAPAPAMPSAEPVDDTPAAPPVSAPAAPEEVVADLSPDVANSGPLPTTGDHEQASDGARPATAGGVSNLSPDMATSGPSLAAGGQDRATQEKPYVSPLRGLKLKKADPRRQQLIDGLAAFDEETRARLAEGLRPVEEHVPKGVGRRVLDSLGSHLDPGVHTQLELRQMKKRARSTAFETGRDLTAQLAAMRSQGKLHGDEFGQTEVMRDVANRHRARLEYELDAGCYEDVDEALTTWKAEHPQVAKFSATDREDYVQRGHIALDEALEQAQRDRQGGD